MKAKSKKKSAAKAKPKAVKKATKKAAKKSAKKATKKTAKKVTVKKTGKKTNKKATPKKATKKVTKKTNAKKPAKKVVKKTTASKTTKKKLSPKSKVKKSVNKAPSKAVQAKKVKVAKPAPKAKAPVIAPAAATTPPFTAHVTSLKAGDKAPFFEGTDQNGQPVNLAGFLGKKVILYFYPKDDTPGCTAEACSLRDEYQVLGTHNYAVVGVSADDEASHAKFASKYELPFPLIADTEMNVIKAYDVWGPKMFMGKIYDGIIRTTFIIDENGTIEKVITDVDTKSHAQQILAL